MSTATIAAGVAASTHHQHRSKKSCELIIDQFDIKTSTLSEYLDYKQCLEVEMRSRVQHEQESIPAIDALFLVLSIVALGYAVWLGKD
jgi:hypothetical protein